MTLLPHVQTLGRGPGRSRSLTQDEAAEAMAVMLSGQAAPEAIGALLMLLRMKGETAQEIAGFAQAAQQALPELAAVDLDWPSYAAGRTRGRPWFLLSARLVAMAGYRVLLHGWNGRDDALRAHLEAADIPSVRDPCELGDHLTRHRIAYLPLETLSPDLFVLLQLRNVLGLRSCINTVCRMLNPGRAATSVQGVFHPGYRLLQADAAALLGWSRLCVIKGGGGEFERNPGKEIAGFGLRDGAPWQGDFAPLRPETCRLNEIAPDVSLADLWSGQVRDAAATAVVTGTAALALDLLGHQDAETLAHDIWQGRRAGPAV
ncbi:MAG: glycosyl transferase family protein [Pseudorhodobacter sp.]